MAPHIQRDYHSIGDPSRYSLRTFRHGEKHCLQSHNFDVSKVNGKEDFFRCMGLQMKRYQYKYKMPNSDHKIKKINIPTGVTLRDCRVIILGATCELCGKCFKCKTDLNIHNSLKHQTREKIHIAIKGTQCTENDIDVWEEIPKSLNYTIESSKNFITKLHKKLHLTLKIGKEVISKISVKRKHLKRKKIDIHTQTELHCESELITGENEYESVVSRIDPSVFCNSPCLRCSCIHVVESSNRYVAGNIVADEQVVYGNNIMQEENHISNRLSCTTCANEKCSVVHEDISSSHVKYAHNKTKDELQNDNLSESTDISSKTIRQTCLQNKNENKKETDINANQIQKDFIINEIEKYASENLQDISNKIQVIVPLIMPIIVPNTNVSNSPIKLTIQSMSIEQKEQQQSLQPEEGQQHYLQEQLQEKQKQSQQYSQQQQDQQMKQKQKQYLQEQLQRQQKQSQQCSQQQQNQQMKQESQQHLQQDQQMKQEQQQHLQQDQQMKQEQQQHLQKQLQEQQNQHQQLIQEKQMKQEQQQHLQQNQQMKQEQQQHLQEQLQEQQTQHKQLLQEEQMKQDQQQYLQEKQHQLKKISILTIKDDVNNEIEEVLRIVRGRITNTEINHESPTRFEQEMLVQDAIRDMKRMEAQGWHLLEKKINGSIMKRKRNIKSNIKCNNANDECAKRKKNIVTESNTEYKNLNKEKYISNVKEHTKIQSNNNIVSLCASDNIKENLMTCNENINTTSEILRQYNINYCNDIFEIKNNTENIRESISRFLAPCSGGMENRSNVPVVIDLVNGTDE
ncbi:probable basic-leucine zipper transcription factor Q isoform X1 [Apis dorsata]|uniref:probable basic-leucine zipper transcription factor Q isoform X1 n=1 Tax=Apis dorsata TaxID=7462 RepID=UPI0003DF4FD6|nr:probable basic-leucine zipper transcription factor Q isoform X1 [Apis dorsata]